MVRRIIWLPVRRRAFGQGFQHSGSRLGAALAPALVVALIALSGRRPVFYVFGAVGIVWAMVWYAYYRDCPAVSVSWAICIDIGGDFSGSVSSVMNTWGNVGGAFSAVMVGYLATLFGWTSPFLLASGLCLFSALLVSRIDPRRPATELPVREYKTSRSIPV